MCMRTMSQVLGLADLVGGGDEIFFAASGVTSGNLLRGVRYTPEGAVTHSIVMRSKVGIPAQVNANAANGMSLQSREDSLPLKSTRWQRKRFIESCKCQLSEKWEWLSVLCRLQEAFWAWQ